MPTQADVRRDSARAFFEYLTSQLDDEVLTDHQCVRMVIEKAATEHLAQSRKRFDPESVFRHRILYTRIDEAIANWCRKREIRADPYRTFRYEGPERGPTQHESAVGLARPIIERTFDRMVEKIPELADCRAAVFKDPTKAITPAFRLQDPLPFGAAGEVKYGASRKDLDRIVYQVAMYAATGGDTSRGWRYDCAVAIVYGSDPPKRLLGPMFEEWPELRARLWETARAWVILL